MLRERGGWSVRRAALIALLAGAALQVPGTLANWPEDRLYFEALVSPYPWGAVGYFIGRISALPLFVVLVVLVQNGVVALRSGAGKAFFWPAGVKAEPSGVARLGRVMHWAFALGAVACGISAVVTLAVPSYALGFAAGAVGLSVFGRAVRYVLAGE